MPFSLDAGAVRSVIHEGAVAEVRRRQARGAGVARAVAHRRSGAMVGSITEHPPTTEGMDVVGRVSAGTRAAHYQEFGGRGGKHPFMRPGLAAAQSG